MQQVPYDPPNVAGWEGGLAWLNTTTVQARFEFVKSCQYLKHNPTGYPGSQPVADVPGETAQAAFDRASPRSARRGSPRPRRPSCSPSPRPSRPARRPSAPGASTPFGP